ncbi:hypothetical protein HHK36_002735 [Tetracentron sinense]|uniref:X8 domain-containing protein n=1 Tax=Tetracentron sinense TaxID=13715 RepID=A0A834ZS11_TETSI|nr:hypothetical protein HHK36_002735 [Tetracentron sinense]
MLKMVCFVLLIGLSDAGQESVKLLNLHDPSPVVLQALSYTGVPVAVSVSKGDLDEVSSSVLMAESWVRTHVLSSFPATKITTIVVGNTVLCNREYEEKWGLVLPSVKNIYYSLVRWGLEKEIKVSAAFSTDCLNPYSATYRDDLAERVVKPLLDFIQKSNSTYSINPSLDFSPSLSDEAINMVSAHSESMKKLGFFNMKEINVVISSPKEKKPMNRKLSFMNSKLLDPYPARPTPLPELIPSPIRSSIGVSVPAHASKTPLPPLVGIAPPPSSSFSFAPEGPPVVVPSNPPEVLAPSSPPEVLVPSYPPDVPILPPCIAADTGAPTPETGEEKGIWCVAKPSVPADTLQEAMDYACGKGGADCGEIMPSGSCYYPDTAVAHASYAFNSYWQKNKNNGGTCGFGGTAMLINSDPKEKRNLLLKIWVPLVFSTVSSLSAEEVVRETFFWGCFATFVHVFLIPK